MEAMPTRTTIATNRIKEVELDWLADLVFAGAEEGIDFIKPQNQNSAGSKKRRVPDREMNIA